MLSKYGKSDVHFLWIQFRGLKHVLKTRSIYLKIYLLQRPKPVQGNAQTPKDEKNIFLKKVKSYILSGVSVHGPFTEFEASKTRNMLWWSAQDIRTFEPTKHIFKKNNSQGSPLWFLSASFDQFGSLTPATYTNKGYKLLKKIFCQKSLVRSRLKF